MKNSTIYKTLIYLIIIFCSFSCSNAITSSSPGDSIVKAYDFMKNKQFEKASKMYVTRDGKEFSEPETQKMEGLAAMAYEQHEKKDGVKNIEIQEETISEDGNSAKVKYIIHFKNGDKDNETTNLLKIDGKWFIKV
jgi:hypothetical protein